MMPKPSEPTVADTVPATEAVSRVKKWPAEHWVFTQCATLRSAFVVSTYPMRPRPSIPMVIDELLPTSPTVSIVALVAPVQVTSAQCETFKFAALLSKWLIRGRPSQPIVIDGERPTEPAVSIELKVAVEH